MANTKTRNAIILNEQDNVATMLQDVVKGQGINMGLGDKIESITAITDIPFGHKVARQLIKNKTKIKKYGTIIGEATADIQLGEHVHTQNVVSLRGRGDLSS